MFMSMWRTNVLILFILAPLAAVLAQNAPTEMAATQKVPALQQRNPRYQVMPSDVMVVAFPLSPELNQETVTVQPDGFIALNNVGSIYVQGLTTLENEPYRVDARKQFEIEDQERTVTETPELRNSGVFID